MLGGFPRSVRRMLCLKRPYCGRPPNLTPDPPLHSNLVPLQEFLEVLPSTPPTPPPQNPHSQPKNISPLKPIAVAALVCGLGIIRFYLLLSEWF